MDTLILSWGYEPLEKTTWKRAMWLVVKGVAEVVHEYSDRVVRTAHKVFKMPSIIRWIKESARKRWGKTIKWSAENLWLRDRGECQYCGKKCSKSTKNRGNSATVDHVLPQSRGGRTSFENCVISCFDCNQRKADRTPEEAKMPLLNIPYKPSNIRERDLLHITNGGRDVPEEWKVWLGLKGI